MKSCDYGVFERSVSTVGILVWVEAGWEMGFDVVLHQSLEALGYDRCDSDWAIVFEAVNGG